MGQHNKFQCCNLAQIRFYVKFLAGMALHFLQV